MGAWKGTYAMLAAAAILILPAGKPAGRTLPEHKAEELSDTLASSMISGSRMHKTAGHTYIDSASLKGSITSSLADLLAHNTALFIKQSGRASLSTVSLRGTSSSHTQVLWNGMKINSPTLGMTDFSLIPAYFTDMAEVLHGPASLREVSGGLGGAISLETRLPDREGVRIEYIQGFGSFLTADEYLEAGCRKGGFSSRTRILLSTSRNDFRYLNMDKKEITYDGQMNIIDSRHPVERNRNGEYRDLHVMQEAGYDFRYGNSIRFSVWYTDSWRQQPPLTVDYGSGADYLNEQKEKALRMTAGWNRAWNRGKAGITAGYAWGWLGYEYGRDFGNGVMNFITNSVTATHTGFLKGETSWRPGRKWFMEASLTAYLHSVRSEDASVITQTGQGLGYQASRAEISAFASVKWKPAEPLSVSLSIREESCGGTFSPPMPEIEAAAVLIRKWDFRLRASASGNYRYPTLNDMYYIPGGNPELRPERSLSYDAGYSFSRSFGDAKVRISASGSWFDSYIRDWIMWVPDGGRKNFWTPLNVMQVHAFGVEQGMTAGWKPGRYWEAVFTGNFTWSPSRNLTAASGKSDRSSGRQLPYIPEYSGSFNAALSYRGWSLMWKWCWYSRRYTTSDNSVSVTGSVVPYIMNDLSLRKNFRLKRVVLDVCINVNNLFNKQYVTVLSRPMPGTNYEILIGITPEIRMKRQGRENGNATERDS